MSKAESWSDEELRASVEVYLEMLANHRSGRDYTKRHYYSALRKDFPSRSIKSFEYRMQNISMCSRSWGVNSCQVLFQRATWARW